MLEISLVLCIHLTAATASDERASAVDSDSHRSSIQLCSEFLRKMCRQDGQFIYRIYLDGTRPKPRYNILRHAGAIYSLAQVQDLYPSEENLRAIVRASDFLRRYIFSVADSDTMNALWSLPELEGTGDFPEAKLGGAGLALVALTSTEQACPGIIPREELVKLGNFILFMQKPDGNLYSKFLPIGSGRSDEWTSLYYPGEAALGLVMLYEITRDEKWREAATKALLYLDLTRAGHFPVEADHWAVIATCRLLVHETEEETRKALIAHAAKICKSILATRSDSGPVGCFTGDGRTTPTATRLEALIPAVSLLSDEVLLEAQRAIDEGIAFLIRTVIDTGAFSGAVPRAISNEASAGARDDEVRIDYIQHAISAFCAYEMLTRENAKVLPYFD